MFLTGTALSASAQMAGLALFADTHLLPAHRHTTTIASMANALRIFTFGIVVTASVGGLDINVDINGQT